MTQIVKFDYEVLSPDDRVALREASKEIKRELEDAFKGILRVGASLVAVQQRLANHHEGVFQAWVEAEFDWSKVQAYRFINIYTNLGSRTNLAQLELTRSVLYELGAPNTPETAVDEVIARAEAGEAITVATAKAVIAGHKAELPAARMTTESSKGVTQEAGVLPSASASEAAELDEAVVPTLVRPESDSDTEPDEEVTREADPPPPASATPRGIQALEALYNLHARQRLEWIAPGLLDRELRGALVTLQQHHAVTSDTRVNARGIPELVYQIQPTGCQALGKPALIFAAPIPPAPVSSRDPKPKKKPKRGSAEALLAELKGAGFAAFRVVRHQGDGFEYTAAFDSGVRHSADSARAAAAEYARLLQEEGYDVIAFDCDLDPGIAFNGCPSPMVRFAADPLNDEWYTPAQIIETVRAFYGGTIDLDPASCEDAQQRICAQTYYTRESDGLAHRWRGKVWINPPYSYPLVEQFALKLIAEVEVGNVEEAILLINNRSDADYFHRLLRAAPLYVVGRGRINFVRPNRELPGNRQGQYWFYFGDRLREFIDTFSQYGTPVRLARSVAYAR